ncbi:hypothetical protein WJ972_03550 [Achromobacter insuavis]
MGFNVGDWLVLVAVAAGVLSAWRLIAGTGRGRLLARVGAVVSLAVSAFCFWLWYEQYLKGISTSWAATTIRSTGSSIPTAASSGCCRPRWPCWPGRFSPGAAGAAGAVEVRCGADHRPLPSKQKGGGPGGASSW